MNNSPAPYLTTLFRGCRVALHLIYGALLAIAYPHLEQARRRRTLRQWNKQLLGILNVGIQIDGEVPTRGTGGFMLVANHISWLDVLVLNAICPARFIAKSEVRGLPFIGWLSRRTGNVCIERAMRQDAASNAASVNRHVRELLEQGICVGLFPEGAATDGRQVGHFHSALFQPAIDAGARLRPTALRYRNESGTTSTAAFTGDMSLLRSVWRILRCRQLNALVAFTPALATVGEHRRALARAAQQAVAHELLNIAPKRQTPEPALPFVLPQAALSAQSAYVLLLDPILNHLPK
ncbi:MAG TPA: lysophospholipid acyltransferase family protein [Gallionella sp.]|nr:lysophospholipid acyltransferase family protein [Gallionella sp.]